MTDRLTPAEADQQITSFITQSSSSELSKDTLLREFREVINERIIRQATGYKRRDLRNYLESKELNAGSQTGFSVESCLLCLLDSSKYPLSQTSNNTTLSNGTHSTMHAKRDFIKIPRHSQDKYSGPYEQPLLDTVKRRFIDDCNGLEVPENERLSVMYLVLRGQALKYFQDHVVHTARTIDEAFQNLRDHFHNAAQQKTNITKWNTINFSSLVSQFPNKGYAEILDLLMSKGKDLATLLGPPYDSPRLLRDFLERATEREPFTRLMIGQDLTIDPDVYLARLHDCLHEHMRREGRDVNIPTLGSASAVPSTQSLLSAADDVDENADYVVYYNHNNVPMFKRRIIRKHPLHPSPRTVQSATRQPSFNTAQPRQLEPKLNPMGPGGKVLRCHNCDSWFHLVNKCFYKQVTDKVLTSSELSISDASEIPLDNRPPAPCNSNCGNYERIANNPLDTPADTSPDANSHTMLTALEDVREMTAKDIICTHRAPAVFNMASTVYKTTAIDDTAKSPTHPLTFDGICIDHGSTSDVCGLPQYQAYLQRLGYPSKPLKMEPCHHHIRFGGTEGQRCKAIGIARVRIPVSDCSFLERKFFVVNSNVPMLLGLKSHKELGTITNLNTNPPRLEFPKHGFSLPLSYKHGHLYIQYPDDICLFTASELARIHRNLGHPSAKSAYDALQRAYPLNTTIDDYKKLVTISGKCYGCQRFSRKPNRYRATLPDPCVFNQDIVLDVMFIDKRAVLHIVCKQTCFSRAAFLLSQTSIELWNTLMRVWILPYLGPPYTIWVDQAKAFLSKEFKSMTETLGCTLKPVATEAHWSLIVERHHGPLRQVYNRLRIDYPHVDMQVLLDYSTMTINNTAGPENFSPALLAFGAQPRLPIGDHHQAPQTVRERFDIAMKARAEYEVIVTRKRLQRASSSFPPNERFLNCIPGDDLLVFRENFGWKGPYTYVSNDGKVVKVLDHNGREHHFHATQVKPYNAHTRAPVHCLLNPEPPSYDANTYSATHITVVIDNPYDERFDEAKKREVHGILTKGGFEIVKPQDVPRNANIISNRYVLAIKDPGTDSERLKARLILQGHRDQERNNIANDAPVLMRYSIRIIISLSVNEFDCKMLTRDVEQAYIQSLPLPRPVYTPAPKEANLPPNTMLRVIQPHYGLVESGTIWFDTYYPVYKDKLLMDPADIDPCLLFKTDQQNLTGIVGLVTDDSLVTGTDEFIKQEHSALKTFKTKSHVNFPLRFYGKLLKKIDNGIHVSQSALILRLKPIPEDATTTMSMFRSIRGSILYIAQCTRIDVSYRAALLSQVTEKNLDISQMKEANSIVEYLQQTANVALRFDKLDRKSIRLCVYVDASPATSHATAPHLGVLIALCDHTGRCHLIHWSSTKCHRSTQSMIGAELYAFSLGFDYGFSFRQLLRNSAYPKIDLYMFTDNKSLFSTITKAKRTRELRLMTDIAELRRAYKSDEIKNVAWLRSDQNPADGLTRKKASQILTQAFTTGYMRHKIEEWIYKDDAS